MRIVVGLFVCVVLGAVVGDVRADGAAGSPIPIILEQSPRDWIDVFQALLTPTIAVAAVLIGYLQWRINSLRLKHELFDRRYEIYQRVQEAFWKIKEEGSASLETVIVIRRTSVESQFVFGDDVLSYLDELIRRAMASKATAEKHERARNEKKNPPLSAKEIENYEWLLKQPPKFQKVVLPYMALDERRGWESWLWSRLTKRYRSLAVAFSGLRLGRKRTE